MPRGRHRHSPPLHRILPISAVAGVPVLCAAGAWLLADPLVLRGLVTAAAAAAVTGAYLMRGWDRDASRRVAELKRARAGDAWRAEERVAELESSLEETRELRVRLEAKLRRKRVELANLRGEHAALLRRYANAETGRASALEGRRRLALQSTARRELPPARSTPTPGAYLRAAQALEDLSRNGALQEARRAAEETRRATEETQRRDLAERARKMREAQERRGAHATAADDARPAKRLGPPVPLPAARPAAALPPARPAPADGETAPEATPRHRQVPQGSFDFFGTQKERAAIESVQDEDLADVVGEEALAAHRTDAAENQAAGQVIDLTQHDETEQMDVVELRSAIS